MPCRGYFFGGDRKGRGVRLGGWMRGWLDIGRRCSYACAYARSRTRSFVFFAVTSVTVDGIENTSSSPKRRIVLWKVTCRFVENNVSFCGK